MDSIYELPNLDGFEDSEFICSKGEFELHKVRQKDTNSIFLAMIFELNFDKIGANQIINLYREINILPKLNHRSLLKFVYYSPVDFSKDTRPTILMEFCEKTSLYSIFQEDDTKKLIAIYGIASGMSYLHSHNIIHRDLKPENIFVDDRLFPKISFFHLIKEIDPLKQEKSDFLKGTPAYLAPEIFTKREYSKKSDVFSFSLVVYQIITNKIKLYKGYKNSPSYLRQYVINGGRPTLFEKVPECYEKLIKKCWSNDPEERPTFDEIIELLKKDRSFITEGVNEREFREYIKYIDDCNFISFDKEKRVTCLDDVFQSKLEYFSNFYNFRIQNIYDTELDSIDIYLGYINLKYFVKGKLIGRGRYANFYEMLFYDRKSGAYLPYVIKIFLTKREKVFSLFSKEVINHHQLYHPCISAFVGYSLFDFEKKNYPSIIFNFYANYSLDKHLNKCKWDYTNKLIVIYGIAAGMSYLHSNDLIHRDLNPSNIFLDNFLFPKIGGFVTVKEIFDDDQSSTSSYVVNKTPIYAAPETLKSNKNTKKSDVYSFAMILYEIVTNRKPFDGLTQYEIVKNVIENEKRPEIQNEIPICYKNLIEKCWSQNPKERPTFDEIITIIKTDERFNLTEKIKKYIRFVDGEINVDFSEFTSNPIELNEVNKSTFSVDLKPIDLNQFEINKQDFLGEGSFGKVFKVTEKKTKQIYAAKILNHPLETCSNDQIININREIKINKQLNCPSIIKFIGYNPNNFENEPKPTIIIEFAPKGTLHDIISMCRNGKLNKEWTETKKLIMIYGIAVGMSYLHSKNIIHRDLKPSNIFLDDFLFPKIGDFGLSKELIDNDNDDKIDFNYKLKGTFSYLAPEVIKNHFYSKASDVYAFALIVFQLITYKRPFSNLTRYQLMLKIPDGFRPELSSDVPACYQNLITKCWHNDPEKRLSFNDIVNILKTDDDFITENVDKNEFFTYVNYIDDFIKKEEKY